MKSTPPNNPIGTYLTGVSVVSLAYVGIVMVTGTTPSFRPVATLLGFLCGFVFTLWTLFAIRIGRISVIGQRGQVSTFERSRQPVLFLVTAALYLTLGVATAGYLGSVLLR